MNKPPALNTFLFASADSLLGSVETPPLLRVLRPASFALLFIIFCAQVVAMATTGDLTGWPVLLLSTLLFAGVHLQFWYEESEQGRRFHHSLERLRGRQYEDEFTGLPNSRHFVFELRRQMMRSVRNGRGFSLVLTDLSGSERDRKDAEKLLPGIGRTLRQASSDGDFIAHLEGPVFAAVVMDDRERTAADKADVLRGALGSCIPLDRASVLRPVVSLTGYQGELEVRDFLRRAQRDLVGARTRGRQPATQGQPRTAANAA